MHHAPGHPDVPLNFGSKVMPSFAILTFLCAFLAMSKTLLNRQTVPQKDDIPNELTIALSDDMTLGELDDVIKVVTILQNNWRGQ